MGFHLTGIFGIQCLCNVLVCMCDLVPRFFLLLGFCMCVFKSVEGQSVNISIVVLDNSKFKFGTLFVFQSHFGYLI